MGFIRNPQTAYPVRWFPNFWDIFALLMVFAMLALVAWNATQMTTPYEVGQSIKISLDAKNLPFYAARTVMRMLIALCFSLLFTFIFGTWAAKSKHAEKIIIPLIDVLQSVPILGFLSVSVAAFIALFPGSMLGPECATIFVIFTSQAWNMAIGFYQTVRAVPAELIEASRMFHLSAWQRFWRIEVPYSMQSLLWNMMASMSAGWFFVVAAEAITVSQQEILLPGIGSFIAVAIQAADMRALAFAVLTMFVVIIIYDQLLFRPLVAWADKFKSELQVSDKMPESWVINLLRRTRLMRRIGDLIAQLFDHGVNNHLLRSRAKKGVPRARSHSSYKIWREWLWNAFMVLFAGGAFIFLITMINREFTLHETWHVFLLGLITAFRVFILIILSSLVWVPIGVLIGLRPRVAQWAEPMAQILSAFPANLLYPFFVMFIVSNHLSANIWLTPLMILGAQWYILFNVIAGASTIPKDLLQVVDNFGVSGRLRWLRLLLPAIFPYYVTGAITAAGGAWNASIVAEVATWGNATLVATGLGAYIAQYTTAGDFPRSVLGIGMMCILVFIFNRLIWRPLFLYAQSRFLLA